jgi:Na+/citrate or Na+/malate symporter
VEDHGDPHRRGAAADLPIVACADRRLVALGKAPTDISVPVAILAVGGFTCAEVGRRLPWLGRIGAGAIFATFIPSYLAYSHALPAPLLKNLVQFTNFPYLFIA